jgi:hypothetical protein
LIDLDHDDREVTVLIDEVLALDLPLEVRR